MFLQYDDIEAYRIGTIEKKKHEEAFRPPHVRLPPMTGMGL